MLKRKLILFTIIFACCQAVVEASSFSKYIATKKVQGTSVKHGCDKSGKCSNSSGFVLNTYSDYGEEENAQPNKGRPEGNNSRSEKKSRKWYKPINFQQLFVKAKAGFFFSDAIQPDDHMSRSSYDYTFGVAVGSKIKKQIYFDIEYNYRHQNNTKLYNVLTQNRSYKQWKVTSHTMTGNLSYYLYNEAKINPYVRGGLGFSRNTAGNFSSHGVDNSVRGYQPGETTNDIAWQMGGGLSFEAAKNMNCDLEYMFINRGKFQTKPVIVHDDGRVESSPREKSTIKDNQVSLGLTFYF